MTLTETRARLDDGSPAVRADAITTSERRSVRRVLALFAGALLLLQLGWVVAFPPFWGMDEADHVFRASSVASGHWEPSTTTPSDRLVASGEIMRVRSATGPSRSPVLPGGTTPCTTPS
jgi:hypothetical protein